MLLIVENIYIYDIESISLLDGEYGKPIYRYDIILKILNKINIKEK